MTVSYIGLGSNLGQPIKQLINAKKAIQAVSEISIINCSSVYQSKALTLDKQPQNDYLNAVIQIETQLAAEHLLDTLQSIEMQQGRTREKRWGARTIDLDILLYADQQIKTDRLMIPHTEMTNRNFVLTPLFQIAPNLDINRLTTEKTLCNRTLKSLLQSVSDQELVCVGELHG